MYTPSEKALQLESKEKKIAEEPSTSNLNKNQITETEIDNNTPKCVICHLGRITPNETQNFTVQQISTPSTGFFLD